MWVGRRVQDVISSRDRGLLKERPFGAQRQFIAAALSGGLLGSHRAPRPEVDHCLCADSRLEPEVELVRSVREFRRIVGISILPVLVNVPPTVPSPLMAVLTPFSAWVVDTTPSVKSRLRAAWPSGE